MYNIIQNVNIYNSKMLKLTKYLTMENSLNCNMSMQSYTMLPLKNKQMCIAQNIKWHGKMFMIFTVK